MSVKKTPDTTKMEQAYYDAKLKGDTVNMKRWKDCILRINPKWKEIK